MVVKSTKQINSVELDDCQDEPLLVSTFYFYFIKWYLDNYNEILEMLIKCRKEARTKVLNVHSRLKETYLSLTAAFTLFLQYCIDRDFVLPQDAEKILCDFRNLLHTLVLEQNERTGQGRDNDVSTQVDYLNLINTMYRDGLFRVVDSIEQFDDNTHDGTIHSGCLWLRSEKFVEKVHSYCPFINFDNMISTLAVQNALKLKPSEKRYTNQLSRFKGKRFYAIWLNKLQSKHSAK